MAARPFQWLLRRFPSRSCQADEREIVMLTGTLVAGILFFVPITGRVLRAQGIPVGPGAVFPLVAVCVAYGLLAARIGRVTHGLFVAFVVFVTVWAPALPWAPTPGSLAWATTQNWLSAVALVGLLIVYTWHGWKPQTYFSKAHFALGGFVIWILLSVPFVAGPHSSFAFQFGLYMLQAWAIFAVVSWLGESGRLSLVSASMTLAIVVVGHAVIGLFEFRKGVSFGLAGIPDGMAAVSRISLGPLGIYSVGPFVSGFTGSGALGSLLAMVSPLLCVLALRAQDSRRFVWVLSWFLSAFVLRMTGWDTGRGAFLLGTMVMSIGLVWRYYTEHGISTAPIRIVPAASSTLTIALGAAIMLLPSRDAGNPLQAMTITTGVMDGSVRPINAFVGVARAANETTKAATTSAGYGPKYVSPESVVSAIGSFSVPLFDLSSLAVRLRQVAAGFDLFLQYPVFGIGGANFYFIAEAFGLPKQMWIHNVYVALLAETGMPGLLFYIAALGFTIKAGERLLLRRNDTHRVRSDDWLLSLGVVAALCAHLGTMLFQPTYVRAQLLFPFWTLGGLLVGSERRRRAN